MRRLLSCVCIAALIVLAGVAPASGVAAPDAPTPVAAGMRQTDGVSTAVGDTLRGVTAAPGGRVDADAVVDASAVTLFSNDLEGGGTWNVIGGPANWGLTTYRKSNGAMSMYCAQTGRPAPGPYLNDSDTWMIAGPFNLVGYSSAVVNFDVWLQSEFDGFNYYDYLFVGGSGDGANFNGAVFAGDSGGWQNVTVDLSAYAGRSSVFIGFQFSSDESFTFEGAYIDRVSLVAQPGNTPPVAVADAYTVSSGKLRSVNAPGVLANDVDANGDRLYSFPLTMPIGVMSLASDGSFTYQSPPGWTGVTAFDYHVSDAQQYSSPVAVTITVVPDTPPVAFADSYTVVKNTRRVVGAPGVLANDTDAGSDPLEAEIVDPPLHGDVALFPSGAMEYMPDADYVGTDSFTYRADDGVFQSGLQTVTINVVTSPPVAVQRFYNSRMGTHFYTADPAETQRVIDQLSGTYRYEGPAYVLQPANNSCPLFRFYNRLTGTHFYTINEAERSRVITTMSNIYTYEGVAYNVSGDSGGSTKPAVHRFFRPSTGTHFYTADPAELELVRSTLGHVYAYDGPAFFLGQ